MRFFVGSAENVMLPLLLRRVAVLDFSRAFQRPVGAREIPASRQRRLNSGVADATREHFHHPFPTLQRPAKVNWPLRGHLSAASRFHHYLFVLVSLLVLSGTTVLAQQPAADPLGDSFFTPELVMQHQQALGLNEEQKAFFKTNVREVQRRFTEWQWALQDEMEKLLTLVKQPQVDEAQTLAQLDKILNLERDIKRAQIALLVRIKNKLTPEQQARLRELRKK